MTRISRTAALSAAVILALGISACSPPHQKNSDASQITTVSPDPGYKGAGQPTTSATESAAAAATDSATGATGESVDGTTLTFGEPAAR